MNPTAQYGINKDYITQAENFADRVSINNLGQRNKVSILNLNLCKLEEQQPT